MKPTMIRRFSTLLWFSLFLLSLSLQAAVVVPPEIEMPGTQPGEVVNLESPDKCDNCHSGYNTENPEIEPATGWRGGAMGNAGRDPLFWATMAIAEQDFDGSGDLCIRCHSTGGWYAGRSTPTDGSGLAANDSDGVDCDACHSITNTDNSDSLLKGVMNAPYVANQLNASDPDGVEGYYGSGMLSLWNGGDKLGPYDPTEAKHNYLQSTFLRDVDYCGSCHDVSNPAVGDLAPGHGSQPGAPAVISSGGNLGGPVAEKAAFNNPPYAYGIVERTFSEYKSSTIPSTRVSDFAALPENLRVAGGALQLSYQAAQAAATEAIANGGNAGDYADGTTRYFSCQTCHMRPVVGRGAKQATKTRTDLPLHDHTGGNYWMADVIKYQNTNNQLRLGGDLTAVQIDAIDRGQQRAKDQLRQAAALEVNEDTLRVINLTGHKLISGYPEGRRMWLNIKWYGADDTLLREDGTYGPLVNGSGQPVKVANPAGGPDIQVESILDLDDPQLRIYEAHYAMTKEWADTLISVGTSASLVLNYDRYTGLPNYTLQDLANQSSGSYHETLHFVLNNHVAGDTRIPPYGMRYDEAKRRNVLPVPENQYGNPGAGGIYDYWDDVNLNPPTGAVRADIDLLYQGTSWEYVQFLDKANKGTDPAKGGNAFLGEEGSNMMEAWLNTGMVRPFVMASTDWSIIQNSSGARFFPVSPCRIFDTRVSGSMISANTSKSFYIWEHAAGDILSQGGTGDCNVPATAKAAVINLTSTEASANGHFRIFPFNELLTSASIVNFNKGVAMANATQVPLCQPSCTFDISVYSSVDSHVVGDVMGYFE